MWGRQDPICHVSGAEALVRALPEAQADILHRCGHMPRVQYPAHVAGRLAQLPTLPAESHSAARAAGAVRDGVD